MDTIAKQTGTFQSFDGTPIYYEVRGEGEPLILVYGIACLMNHWHHQVRHFSQDMKTVVFDLRGHHRSQPLQDPTKLRMEDLAEDLIALVDHLGLPSAHFAGHSFGVPVLLAAYEKRPDLFKSLCFINGFAQNPIKNMFGLDVVEPFYHFVRSAYGKSPDLWNTLWRMAVDNPVSMRLAALAGGFNLNLTHFKDIEVYARGVAHMELPIFLDLFSSMMEFNATERLHEIKVPTLVIIGENDRVTPKHLQDDFERLIPLVEVMHVPYGSHCTQLDFPDYVNLRMKTFWEKHFAK